MTRCPHCNRLNAVLAGVTLATCVQCSQPFRPDTRAPTPPPPLRLPLPPAPAKKKTGVGTVAAVVIGGIFLIGTISSAISGDGDDPSRIVDPGVDFGSSSHSVQYVVSGASRQADLTYQNANADTSQESGAIVPWDYSFTADVGEFLYISAQRGEAPGDITCSIQVDGVTVETNTSSGPFTICQASRSL